MYISGISPMDMLALTAEGNELKQTVAEEHRTIDQLQEEVCKD